MYNYYYGNKKVTKVIERFYDSEGNLTKEVETHYEEYPSYQPYYTSGGGIQISGGGTFVSGITDSSE